MTTMTSRPTGLDFSYHHCIFESILIAYIVQHYRYNQSILTCVQDINFDQRFHSDSADSG